MQAIHTPTGRECYVVGSEYESAGDLKAAFTGGPTGRAWEQVSRDDLQITDDGKRYRVVRFYRDAQTRRRVVSRNLTLGEAQAHCDDPET